VLNGRDHRNALIDALRGLKVRGQGAHGLALLGAEATAAWNQRALHHSPSIYGENLIYYANINIFYTLNSEVFLIIIIILNIVYTYVSIKVKLI